MRQHQALTGCNETRTFDAQSVCRCEHSHWKACVQNSSSVHALNKPQRFDSQRSTPLNPQWFYLSRTGLPIGAEPLVRRLMAMSPSSGSFQLRRYFLRGIAEISYKHCPTGLMYAWKPTTFYFSRSCIGLIQKMCCTSLLPPVSASSHCCSLWPRSNNRELPDHLVDCKKRNTSEHSLQGV